MGKRLTSKQRQARAEIIHEAIRHLELVNGELGEDPKEIEAIIEQMNRWADRIERPVFLARASNAKRSYG